MKYSFIILLGLFSLMACKNETDELTFEKEKVAKQVIESITNSVYLKTYSQLDSQSNMLLNAIISLKDSCTEQQKLTCQTQWKLTRQYWEYSEAWLFGPVSTESIDPSIDTWPIDNQIIASMCQQSQIWSDSLINTLDGSQKGFHAVEYILFGENGNKSASDFTAGELNLLEALARNLNFQCHNIFLNWNASSDAYHLKLLNTPNELYNNQAVVLIEMSQSLGAICDEVANAKIQDVLIGQDKMAVESPFSSNSMADFKNNVNGVKMVYNGANNTTGDKGLSQVVKLFNLDLDRRIQSAILASEYALNQVSVPFEQAIFTQPVQLQNAVDQLLVLQDLLNTELVQLIQKQYQ
ncbi:MAG: hypothetical protein RLZZ60_1739 [Bacteroidota bacterium]